MEPPAEALAKLEPHEPPVSIPRARNGFKTEQRGWNLAAFERGINWMLGPEDRGPPQAVYSLVGLGARDLLS